MSGTLFRGPDLDALGDGGRLETERDSAADGALPSASEVAAAETKRALGSRRRRDRNPE